MGIVERKAFHLLLLLPYGRPPNHQCGVHLLGCDWDAIRTLPSHNADVTLVNYGASNEIGSVLILLRWNVYVDNIRFAQVNSPICSPLIGGCTRRFNVSPYTCSLVGLRGMGVILLIESIPFIFLVRKPMSSNPPSGELAN